MSKSKSFVRGMVAIFACLFVAAALSGCAQVQGVLDGLGSRFTPTSVEEARAKKAAEFTPQITSPAIKQDGVLTVGLSAGATAPLLISADNGYSGIDVDTACAIADKLGLRVNFVPLPSAADLKNSECDIMMGARSADSSSVAVVGSYAEEAAAFFSKGVGIPISAAELEGKTVGLQSGSSSEAALKETGINAAQQGFANLNEAFDALANGSVDYVLCDAFSGAYLAATYSDITCAGTLDVPSAIGVGVVNENEQLKTAIQEALTEIGSNGVLGIVRSRWIGALPTLTKDSQVTNIPKPAKSN